MDYTKQCWFCGKATMTPAGSYFRCTECGATWNEQPSLGKYIDIEAHRDGPHDTMVYHPVVKMGKVKGGPPLPQIERSRLP